MSNDAMPDESQTDAQATADAVRVGMFANDRASQAMGMRVIDVAPGRATVEMTVRDDMINGFGTCHGGLIAALGDTAFGFACNSSNELTVASGLSVDFIAPARSGDVLVARAEAVSVTRRTGIYDVDIRKANGERIAVFRGRSFRILGKRTIEGDAP